MAAGFYTIDINSRERIQAIDITPEVSRLVADSGVGDGICHLYVPHTTAAVTINESADPAVAVDILGGLARLAPSDRPYLHREGNSDAHIKSTLVGVSQSVPVAGGRLLLGTWQGIFFCEFDGPRKRKIFVKVIAGQAQPVPAFNQEA